MIWISSSSSSSDDSSPSIAVLVTQRSLHLLPPTFPARNDSHTFSH